VVNPSRALANIVSAWAAGKAYSSSVESALVGLEPNIAESRRRIRSRRRCADVMLADLRNTVVPISSPSTFSRIEREVLDRLSNGA
jgi:hypothetical protein